MLPFVLSPSFLAKLKLQKTKNWNKTCTPNVPKCTQLHKIVRNEMIEKAIAVISTFFEM